MTSFVKIGHDGEKKGVRDDCGVDAYVDSIFSQQNQSTYIEFISESL